MFDKIFKIVILVILVLGLYVFYKSSENGRYIYNQNDIIIDTKTGEIYNLHEDFVKTPLTLEDIKNRNIWR